MKRTLCRLAYLLVFAYLTSYVCVRIMSYEGFDGLVRPNQPVVLIGLWNSEAADMMEMSISTWDQGQAERYARSIQVRGELLSRFYAPLIWVDERLTGVEIFPD